MSKVTVKLDDVAEALTTGSMGLLRYFLDRETGQVHLVSEECDPEEGLDPGALRLLVAETEGESEPSGRFLEICELPSHVQFRWMERFVEGLSGRLAAPLEDALRRPKPFRRFKDTLLELPPEIRESWFAFNRERDREAAEEWLVENGVEYMPA